MTPSPPRLGRGAERRRSESQRPRIRTSWLRQGGVVVVVGAAVGISSGVSVFRKRRRQEGKVEMLEKGMNE